MRNEHLRRVVEEIGFGNARSVISSGNLIFESDSPDTAAMEAQLEAAWPERLGFNSTTLVRSQLDLQGLVAGDPFGGMEHGPTSYLLVTFLKEPPPGSWSPPPVTADGPTRIVGQTGGAIFSVTDTTATKTPDFMTYLEKHLGKQISSRTWLTVKRVLARM
jgi:uncharacterized protein (DUF1697 family)